MKKDEAGSVDDLIKFIGNAPQTEYDGQCQHVGCQNQGFNYQYPVHDLATKTDTAIHCHIHRTDIGYCFYCDQPGDCVEGFNPEAIYVCQKCIHQLDQEWEYGAANDDEYDEDDY